MLVAGFGHQNLMCLLINPVIARSIFFFAALQHRRDLIHTDIEVGMVFGLAGNNQRRACFIDQDRVDFIDDGVGQLALHPFCRGIDHVVAQVVKTELVVGSVGDIGRIGSLFHVMLHLRQIDADRQPEEAVQTPHPLSIATGQIIVDGDDMHAVSGQRVQIRRQGSDQCFAFTGSHFGNFAVVQNHATDQLNVEVAHAERPLTCFTDDCKSFRQERVKRLAIGHARLELGCFTAQLVVRQGADAFFQRVDLADNSRVLLDQPIITAAENLLE